MEYYIYKTVQLSYCSDVQMSLIRKVGFKYEFASMLKDKPKTFSIHGVRNHCIPSFEHCEKIEIEDE